VLRDFAATNRRTAFEVDRGAALLVDDGDRFAFAKAAVEADREAPRAASAIEPR